MAKPVSEEELLLKKRARRRLIGALVLVVSVAAVLPMVLDSEPKATSQEVNIQIPSPDTKGGFTAKPVPPAPGKAAAVGKPPAVKEALAPEIEAAPLPAPKPVAEKAPEPAPAKAPEKTLEKAAEKVADKAADKAAPKPTEKVADKSVEPKPAAGTFYIQVAALAEPDKVKQVQQQIIDAGLRSYTEVVAAGKGNVTRVRAGPFASREEAEAARAKLATAGLEGKVAAR